METQINKQFCSICRKKVSYSPRYPRQVCLDCQKRAKSADNRPLSFGLLTLTGGFSARYADTNETYDSHLCYIDGFKCRADEAYMGGIVIQPLFATDKKDQIKGGLLGLLIGDALGVPYEFNPPENLPFLNEIEFEPPPNFRRSHNGVPPGTWSDDGAQALILLNTLLERGKFDADFFAQGLINWYDKGFMAVNERVFDVGIQTANAIRELKSGVKPLLAGGFDEYSNGNGSLMRVLSLVLWHQGTNEELIRDAELQSRITHAHPRSQVCCALYCLWARGILNRDEDAWKNAVEFLREFYATDRDKIAELDFHIRPQDEHKISGSGYVVDSLFSAKTVCENANYEMIVKSAVALGNDTDTTACIAGGIAGLKFGFESIPQRWRENLRGKEIYEPLLMKLLERF